MDARTTEGDLMRLSRGWLTFLVVASFTSALPAQSVVHVVTDGRLSHSEELAVADLEKALAKNGRTIERGKSLPTDGATAILVGTPVSSKTIANLVASSKLTLSREPESLAVKKLGNSLVIAGADSRGLGYALLDTARAIELVPPKTNPLDAVAESAESPFLRTRTMSVHLFNKDLEASWYFDENHWRDYFAMLARDRYNNFNLTFSDQTNYLTPLYAYLVEVPGYENVRVKGLSAAERHRNLAMLKRIAELAQERGIDFTLGIWAQTPVAAYPGQIAVENLPKGMAAAEYCAEGLRLILEACPAITGVQFRMNSEAGVSEKEQAEFFIKIFQALKRVGRSLKIDLRFKGLLAETIQAALDAGLDVAVSIKFWCEHMGLPYHPTVADRHYRDSRYSFGAILKEPRKFRVIYQLWSMGSQRILLWGDPDYATRFAESCKLGGGQGFEVYAPLTNKGYSTEPGAWKLFADPLFEIGSRDYERYWYFYLVFGRMGYNPKTNPEVWRREFRHRCGPAADEIEKAYRSASQIVPFITAVHLPSASEWWWWPEMDTGGRLAEYQRVQPSDPAQFYGIRSFAPTPKWIWEKWDASVPGYVDDALKGRLGGKMTPPEMSRRLRALAQATEQHLEAARAIIVPKQYRELIGAILDLKIAALLGRAHADKMDAATHLGFFEMTKEPGRLVEALERAKGARESWAEIARLADGAYHRNLSFGIEKGNKRTRGDHRHDGTWRDRLVEFDDDVESLTRLVESHRGEAGEIRRYPGELADREQIAVEHRPPTIINAGDDFAIDVAVDSKAAIRGVTAYFRPLDQTRDWKALPLRKQPDGRWHVAIPGAEIEPRWDFQYYFEVLFESGGGRNWPPWEDRAPYEVVKVQQ
jgi:hypothetical protein